MKTRRTAWLLLVCAVPAAACWDGALDPIAGLGGDDSGAPDTDGDSDSDADSDADTDDTGSETVACAVPVSVVFSVWFGEWPPYQYNCNFEYAGTCADAADACEGCAWTLSTDTDACAGDQVCCVPAGEEDSCEVAGYAFSCAYESGTECSDLTPIYDETLEEPVCADGLFCCFGS